MSIPKFKRWKYEGQFIPGVYHWQGFVEVTRGGEPRQEEVIITIERNPELPSSTSQWGVGMMGVRTEDDEWGKAGTEDPMNELFPLEHWYWTYAEAKEAAIQVIQNGHIHSRRRF